MVGTDGTIRLCDFGLAFIDSEERLTETLEQVGSRFYMAPECEHGPAHLISEATDVYSLGKILYFLLRPGLVFPREFHRDSTYDLSTVRSDPYMERFSRLLDRMVTEDPRARGRDVETIAEEVRREYMAYSEEWPVPGSASTYKCVFCRDGTYRQITTTESAHNYGYNDEGNIGSEQFIFLECLKCGNAQRFKRKYGGDRWFPKD